MKLLTTTEGKALLLLCKDFSSNYNATTLAKKLGITRRGALNVVKTLRNEELVISRRYGKAVFYKANLSSPYAYEMLKTLLMTESRQHAKRWVHQFEKLFSVADSVIIFGSVIRDYTTARDIDLIVIVKEKNLSATKSIVQKENQATTKPIQVVWQTPHDFIKNIKRPDPVLLNALKFGYVLHGYSNVLQGIFHAQHRYGDFAVPPPESR